MRIVHILIAASALAPLPSAALANCYKEFAKKEVLLAACLDREQAHEQLRKFIAHEKRKMRIVDEHAKREVFQPKDR